MCVAGIITGVGVLLILAKTIAQTLISPQLVVDGEHPDGMTVSHPCHSFVDFHSGRQALYVMLTPSKKQGRD